MIHIEMEVRNVLRRIDEGTVSDSPLAMYVQSRFECTDLEEIRDVKGRLGNNFEQKTRAALEELVATARWIWPELGRYTERICVAREFRPEILDLANGLEDRMQVAAPASLGNLHQKLELATAQAGAFADHSQSEAKEHRRAILLDVVQYAYQLAYGAGLWETPCISGLGEQSQKKESSG